MLENILLTYLIPLLYYLQTERVLIASGLLTWPCMLHKPFCNLLCNAWRKTSPPPTNIYINRAVTYILILICNCRTNDSHFVYIFHWLGQCYRGQLLCIMYAWPNKFIFIVWITITWHSTVLRLLLS